MQTSKLQFKITTLAILLICLILSLVFKCSQKMPDEQALFQKIDNKGRVLKRVVTGRIPGEDIFLTITQYDTLGRVISEYGAKPYGVKFRSTFKYDNQGRRVEEIIFNFSE